MSNRSLVSVIISTKNEEGNIRNILESLKRQIYKNIEIIIVDNNSTDGTKEIAKEYTEKIYNRGPERSSQRNFGVEIANGEFVFISDADMILTPKVIGECVNEISPKEDVGGIIIPELSIGQGFWAKCKALEKSFYVGVDYIEAARFYRKKVFQELGGFNINMLGGEDWDLSQRVAKRYKIGRINSYIYHNEGKLSLLKTMQKKFYYGKHFNKYLDKNRNLENVKQQINTFKRFVLYLSHPIKLFKNPILGFGMLFMKFCEFGAGGAGYLISKFRKY